jgi:uncharacterized membrane protein
LLFITIARVIVGESVRLRHFVGNYLKSAFKKVIPSIVPFGPGSTVINGSFAKIAVIAVFAAICANLAICTVIYIVKTANCGKLCKLQQNSKITAITVESLYSP